MSGFVYPATLPGLTFDNTRSPNFNTGVQPALSGKESCLAYQLYPIMEFELQYEFLTGASQSSSDIRALLGLFMAMKGQADTFLFNDPEFNTVSLMPFATTDGVTTAFPTTATYQNVGGPGGPELIQNFNGAPTYFVNRFGFNEQMLSVSKTNQLLQSQTLATTWADGNVTVNSNTFIAPDGTMTGDSLIDSTNTNVTHLISQVVTVPAAVGTYTFSFFVYPSRNFCYLQMLESLGGGNAVAWFSLVPNTVGTIQTGATWSGVTATVSPIQPGSLWRRVTITGTKTNAATSITCVLGAATADASGTYTGTIGIDSLRAWGAQFEVGSIASMYVPTVGSVNTITDYTLGPTGIVTIPAPLAAAGILNWSGSFFYRCRFTEDKMTVSQFVNKFWENKQVTIRQKKL